MSIWYTITDPDDIEIDEDISDVKSLDIMFYTDYNGNNYVSIPIEFIIKELEKHGFTINRNTETKKISEK